MTAAEYLSLIKSFLDGRLPLNEFDRQFNAAYRASDEEDLHEIAFLVLDRIWSSLEAYSPDVEPGEEDAFTISEPTLRREVAAAATKLERVIQSGCLTQGLTTPAERYPQRFISVNGTTFGCGATTSIREGRGFIALTKDQRLAEQFGFEKGSFDEYYRQFWVRRIDRWWEKRTFGTYQGKTVSIFVEDETCYFIRPTTPETPDGPSWSDVVPKSQMERVWTEEREMDPHDAWDAIVSEMGHQLPPPDRRP